ncbi:MAG: hypothetical protein JXQ67_10210 [Campylobacterales bacterium]|nr:hypothetical protein [Campylobacterales bacterium]
MKVKTLGSIALASLLATLFSACSKSDSTTVTGYYLDSAVQNIDYSTSGGREGLTGADGSFVCAEGESVTFSIGELELRTLAGVQNGQKFIENNDGVITLLQSIDEDGDPSNGIQITESAKTAVSEWIQTQATLEINASDDKLANIALLEQKLADAGLIQTQSVTLTQAQEHVATTVQEELASSSTSSLGTQVIVGDKIHYVDYKNAVRTAPISAATAEYHTGVGFGNTLFDSSEQKCQHCHNELYDTWAGSMHGKSWTDPIFQSKFQDFLRIQLSKIGTTSDVLYQQKDIIDGDAVGTKNMFSGAAQTCIKCHAPGAYYAGDIKVTVSKIADATDINTTMLETLKAEHEINSPNTESAVIAANAPANAVYKATFAIGHKANQEGINCAFCHSIETPRLMGLGDETSYTLKSDMRVGPHGPVKAAAGSSFTYNEDATNPDMNKFFRLWGPEKPTDYNTTANIDSTGRAADGRYSMTQKDLNGTNGKVHYTGGPFYGPFGVTGIRNENENDETNRSSQVNPHFNVANGFNHFADEGKALCLSCHQRSAGAFDGTAGEFMELCSTWNAVTTGSDNNHEDTDTSPKCQKCHMERIEGTVLHQWASPNKLFTDKSLLTPHFYADDSDGYGADNPVAAKWLNSHGFLGASKTGTDKTAAVAKIKSGFGADVTTSLSGTTLTVTTTLTNKTAHMFPGAHPMRRVFTRLILTDENGTMLSPTNITGESAFHDVTNTLATLTGKTLATSQATTISVQNNLSDTLDFTGKVPDLNGSIVGSQRFYSDSGVGKLTISATDGTLSNQTITNGLTSGLVFNAAIVDSNATQKFTRIYGHETGKIYTIEGVPTFVVRPGFDSNKVESDTRLSPNETEMYTLTYDISGLVGVTARYDVYYMQKGANGQFIEASNGFLDQTASDAAKHLVTQVFTKTIDVQ